MTFKKAHKTHALAQTAGRPYPRPGGEGAPQAAHASADQRLLEGFRELCLLVETPTERARLLGVGLDVDAAWREGRGLPLLRARRRALERSLRHRGAQS